MPWDQNQPGKNLDGFGGEKKLEGINSGVLSVFL